MALLPGSPAINTGSNDLISSGISTDQRGYARIQDGMVDIGAYEFDPLPEVANVTVDNGSTQRSTIKSLQFTFSENVFSSLIVDDLRIRNITTGEDVAATNMALAVDPDTLTATWTFPGLTGGKLAEGNYVATLNAGDVQDTAGNSMVGDYVFEFHVLYGDATGDGKVNALDLLKVRQNYLKAAGSDRDDCADVNSDGKVNALDLLLVRQNYLNVLEVPFDLVVSQTNLSVSEGGTSQFTVALSTQPRGTVEVTVTFTSGDADLGVQSGTTLTFDSTNWSTPQIVTLAAAEDSDAVNGMAVFTVSAANARKAVTVMATESDNDYSLTVAYSSVLDGDSG